MGLTWIAEILNQLNFEKDIEVDLIKNIRVFDD